MFRYLLKINKQWLILLLLIISSLCLPANGAATLLPAEQQLAKQLGWVDDPNANTICRGYYVEAPISYIPNSLAASQANNYNIESGPVTYAAKGTIVLTGGVTVTQPGKEVTAKQAYLYRNPRTNAVQKLHAIGNVHLIEPGKLVIADSGNIDLESNVMILENVLYRLALNATPPTTTTNPQTGQTEYHEESLTAWGKAVQAEQVQKQHYQFNKVTYSTCPIGHGVWFLTANSLRIDEAQGRGYATNSVLYIKGIPVFYLPYLSFPINNVRKSGLLMPTFGTSSKSGFRIGLPYYFNLAPNYDDTFTPHLMTLRGVLFTNEFRYLTEESHGWLNLGFIPNDREFTSFQKDAPSNGEYLSQPQASSLLNRLENASNDRGAITWEDNSIFDEHWSGDVDFNYVTDDYYIQDFGQSLLDNSENQLMQRADLQYQGQTWNFLGYVQGFETLHPITQATVLNQYERVPDLQLNGDFPQGDHTDFSISNEYVYFTQTKQPGISTEPVTGNRLSIRPAIEFPFNWPYAYFTPRLQLQLTAYSLNNAGQSMPASPSAAIPIFDVKSGLFFDRQVNLFGTAYRQTLEPEVYYLFVPYVNQRDLPVFDSAAQPFDYDYMFEDNRFTSIDRIGDADQLTLGVTTRFINDDTGAEKANASIGEIYYFRDRNVSLCTEDTVGCEQLTVDTQPVSPIAATATYNISKAWSANAGIAWNPNTTLVDTQSAGFQYMPNQQHIFNIDYTFLRNESLSGGIPDNLQNALKQVDVSAYWGINERWGTLGQWYYDLDEHHAQAYLFGVEYDSCCWQVRAMISRTFLGMITASRAQFDNTVYIQFALKGLGAFGLNDPGSLLTNSISGYVDNFGQAV